MRQLMLQMREYAESGYTVTNEIAIYDKLLTTEEARIRSQSMSSQVKYLYSFKIWKIFGFVTTETSHG